MEKKKKLTSEELALAKDIMTFSLREASREYGFLDKAVFSLIPEASDKISTVCSDYQKLYYNPGFIISRYSRAKGKIVTSVIHCVLHCLLLHQSASYDDKDAFEAAADLAVLGFLLPQDPFGSGDGSKVARLIEKAGGGSTGDIYRAAVKDPRLRGEIIKLTSALKMDDHDLWYTNPKRIKEEEKKQQAEESRKAAEGEKSELMKGAAGELAKGKKNAAPDVSAAAADQDMKDLENEWGAQFSEAVQKSKDPFYGAGHGNMFDPLSKPSRFSKFSYKEYIKRFARSEIIQEDPETIDTIMYSLGFELYGDIPLIEFSETKEFGAPSDIVIAIDMSGSCGGDTAANFLRQVYTLFEEMDIKGKVKIHVLSFDTQVNSSDVITCAADADRLIKNYRLQGLGGTDFRCVFDRVNGLGRKVKGLFFFSDAYGSFPDEKPKYKTVFFIPKEQCVNERAFGFIPDWIEAVLYSDD